MVDRKRDRDLTIPAKFIEAVKTMILSKEDVLCVKVSNKINNELCEELLNGIRHAGVGNKVFFYAKEFGLNIIKPKLDEVLVVRVLDTTTEAEKEELLKDLKDIGLDNKVIFVPRGVRISARPNLDTTNEE